MKALERELVTEFAKQLKSRYAWVDIHKRPSASPILRQSLLNTLGYVPILQPEIDICMMDDDGAFVAAEVKAFPGSSLGFRLPFYEGIGQALALHRYGVDFAALWFFFYGDVKLALMNQYGAQAWWFVRNELKLNLDFTFFRAVKHGRSYKFDVYRRISKEIVEPFA